MFILSVVANLLLGLLCGGGIFLLLVGLLVVLPQLAKRNLRDRVSATPASRR